MNLYYVYGYLWLYISVNVEFYCNFCIYNAVSVYLLPGVEFVLYIKDHNGNKFYFKLYCVILDKLSVFTTFLSNKKKKKKTNSLDMLAVLHLIVTVLSDRPSFEGGCNVTGQPIWFCPLELTCSTCFHVVVAQHGVDGMLSGGSGGGNELHLLALL